MSEGLGHIATVYTLKDSRVAYECRLGDEDWTLGA